MTPKNQNPTIYFFVCFFRSVASKQLAVLLLIFIVTTTVSCKKGDSGPAGSKGDTGVTGPAGPAGPAGADGKPGSQIYSGTSNPAGTLGAVGDYYLNQTTSILFGPKTANGWGNGTSLKGAAGATGATGAGGATGATGATGAAGPAGATGATGPAGATGAAGAAGSNGANGQDGSQILSGTGVPAENIGNIGDYYLDKTNYLLYGPKLTTGWNAPLSLQGNISIKTETFTIYNVNWSSYITFPPSAAGSVFNTTRGRTFVHFNKWVTGDVINGGVILVYIFVPNVGWMPLPISSRTVWNDTYHITFGFGPEGQVTLYFYFEREPENYRSLDYVLPESLFKVVVVPNQVLTNFLKPKHVDLNDYEAVMKALQLKD